MHLKDIQTMFGYNYWAKDRLLGVVEKLTPEQFTKYLGSSHGSVHGTLTHLMGAEEIWLKRWKGEPITSFRKPEDVPTFEALQNHWKMVEMEVLGFCHMLKTEDDIHRMIIYKDLKGNEYRQPLFQLMQHLINHSTFHRGQIVTMLRQLGVQPVATDMIVYFREISR
jgi:uncharacterized damage-inducible protein DinB